MAEWNQVMHVLLARWPGQVSGWGKEVIAAFVSEIKETANATPDDVIKALRASTSAFPPSAGELTGIVERQRQGPAPTFLEAHRLINRYVSTLRNGSPGASWSEFISQLADHHEAVARYALAFGPQGIRQAPDPFYVQDTGGSTALTRMDRSYALARRGWEEDPRPTALAEAQRWALSAVERGELHKMAVVNELTAGEDGAA